MSTGVATCCYLFPTACLVATMGYCAFSECDPRGMRWWRMHDCAQAAEETIAAASCNRAGVYALFGTPVFFADINASDETAARSLLHRADGHARSARFNTALMIDPTGKRVYRQAKLYPCCEQETAPRVSGSARLTSSTPPAHRRPRSHADLLRRLPSGGVPAAGDEGRAGDVLHESTSLYKLGFDGSGSQQGVMTMHAATNQMWVVQVNGGALVDTMVTDGLPGAGGGSHGQSRIVDPSGRVREQARVFGQQLLVIHDLDLAELHHTAKTSA